MLIDLHVHTNVSDDYTITLEEAVQRCKDAGLAAMALTEFDRVPNLSEVAEVSKAKEFPIFIGVDIDTDDGRMLAYVPDPSDTRFTEQSWDAGEDAALGLKEVMEVVEDLGGAVIAAHPYLDDGGPFLGDRIYKVDGLAGVEIVCGVKRHIANDLALEASAALGLPTVGGSDTGPEGQRLGQFATAFAEKITTQLEFVEALRSGGYWAVELGEPGSTRPRPPPRRDQDRGRGRGNYRGR